MRHCGYIIVATAVQWLLSTRRLSMATRAMSVLILLGRAHPLTRHDVVLIRSPGYRAATLAPPI